MDPFIFIFWRNNTFSLDIEPFDESLDRRIWSLADTRLQWHKRIAETRRTVPINVANSLTTLLKQDREVLAEELEIGEEEYQAKEEYLDGELSRDVLVSDARFQ